MYNEAEAISMAKEDGIVDLNVYSIVEQGCGYCITKIMIDAMDLKNAKELFPNADVSLITTIQAVENYNWEGGDILISKYE